MNNKLIEELINNEYENEYLDFKIQEYDWNNADDKEAFIIDVISMANSKTENDRYIILGVKVKPDGERIINGIDTTKLLDSSVYQQIVNEYIEPAISVEFKVLKIDGKSFGIYRIFNCNDRPYLLKKNLNKREKGYTKIRKGSMNANISRYILDDIYSSKIPKIKSEFKISGLNNGAISDKIEYKKYDFLPDLKKDKEIILDMINEINNLEIDDFDKNQKNTDLHALTLNYATIAAVDESVSNLINMAAKSFKVILKDDFYDLGNLKKFFRGASSVTLNPIYDYNGSNLSKLKYNKINELYERINRCISWSKFEDEIKDFGYIDLVISEIGNTTDEEIEVNIEIPRDNYINYDDFPTVESNIIDEINSLYSEKLFKIDYDSSVSDYRKMMFSSFVNYPKINFMSNPKSNVINGLYEYIDYSVNDNNDKAILNFTIKNMKENETMVFPGRIILKNNPKEIDYNIISRNSKEKIKGNLKIK